MTCIVGYVEKGNVWIGADSQCTTDWTKSELSELDGKVFKKNDILIGVAGSLRQAQLIKHCLTIPTKAENHTDYQYLCRQLVPDIIRCLKKNVAIEIKDDRAYGELSFLLGYNGNLYLVDSSFAVVNTKENYNTTGSGGEVALGVLHCLEGVDIPVTERLTRALKAAARFAIGVRGPFTIMSLNEEE